MRSVFGRIEALDWGCLMGETGKEEMLLTWNDVGMEGNGLGGDEMRHF
jgi:hypothetical protein